MSLRVIAVKQYWKTQSHLELLVLVHLTGTRFMGFSLLSIVHIVAIKEKKNWKRSQDLHSDAIVFKKQGE